MRLVGVIGALGLSLALAGCRATAESATMDLAMARDMANGDASALPPPDMAEPPDLAVCPSGAERCDDGCDNDDNGYIDSDDPACSSQMLVTFTAPGPNQSLVGTPGLWRLILEPTPHITVLDGNPVLAQAMSTFSHAFSPNYFVTFNVRADIDIVRPDGGVPTEVTVTPTYFPRDICIFDGELIVVAPGSPKSTLHRMQADAMTENGQVTLQGMATSCSSDGDRLYVPFHDGNSPSQIAVFAKGAPGAGPVDTGLRYAIPQPLTQAGCGSGCDRLLDMVWVKKSGVFIGLFANSTGVVNDSSILSADLMAQFDFDGGVGAPIASVVDGGGLWHGVGEFLP